VEVIYEKESQCQEKKIQKMNKKKDAAVHCRVLDKTKEGRDENPDDDRIFRILRVPWKDPDGSGSPRMP